MANNIKHQLFSGVFYTALAKYSGIIISLVVAGILARLLSPDDFGVVAIATVIIAFFNLFTDMGISPAIVQHKSLTTGFPDRALRVVLLQPGLQWRSLELDG